MSHTETRDETFERIQKILKEQCDCQESLSLESRLLEDLELDSITLLTLVTELENHYQMTLDPSMVAPPETIGMMIDYIHDHLPSSQ